MNIPKQFVIANNIIKVELLDKVEEDNYGVFKDSSNTIQIAKTVGGNKLTEEQIMNTVWHEIFHVFQFYFNNTFDEAQAQCYANFMREYTVSNETECVD